MKNLQKKSHSAPNARKSFKKPTNQSLKPAKKTAPNRHTIDTKKRQTQSADGEILAFNQVNYLTVTDNQDGQRIDNFLLARLKGLPRSHLYKLIRDDEIRINGKRCKPHDRLNVGDVVRIAPIRLSSKQAPVMSDSFTKGLLNRIIYEDDGLIVFNKPYGMAVHGGSGESFGVIEAMRQALNKKYLELVHRIDKDTSGLLLIAKKRSTLKHLQEQFREKTIHKQYLCLVDGFVKADTQSIDMPLLRYTLANGERRVRCASSTETGAKMSLTKCRILARLSVENQQASLVLAMPATGRTHQIRVHMAHIGHALLGDEKYQKNPQAAAVKRLCLHAWQLTLGEAQEGFEARPSHFYAPLPDDMAELLPETVLAQVKAE